MLDIMRRGAVNWMGKGLLGLLVVAFSFWGVEHWVRNVGRDTLATIGKTQISIEDFRQAYRDEMTSLTRRIGRRLTPEQAKLLGIEQRTLSRLIGSAAIENHARDLRLAISDKGLAELIRQDPAFQDKDGNFSSRAFQSYLRQLGASEGYFVQERRREEIREQITDTLLSGLAPPQWQIEALYRYRDETRVIEFFTPDFNKLVKLADPDEAKLKEVYEQNKRQFVTPELRKINLLLLSVEDVKSRINVSEQDIKTAYDEDTTKFNIPEKRRIQQISFPDKASAEKAYAELSKAKNFTEAATKLGFKESDFELGVYTKRDMIDPKIAEVAFSLKKDELSKPVEGQFSIVLVRVSEITPGKQRPFAEARKELTDAIKTKRAANEVRTLHEKVEEARNSGTPLKKIAEDLKLTFKEEIKLDRSANTSAGKPAIEGSEGQRIAQAAFAAASNVETEAVDLSDGGYAWFDLLGVTAAEQKPFEEVKAEVKAIVLEQERRREVTSIAAKLAERINAGEPMEAVAKETGGKIEKTNAITRNTSPQGLTQNAVQQAFTLPKGRAASALTVDGKSRTIMRVADIIAAPPPKPEQIAQLKTELTRQLQTDVLAQYVGGLQTRYSLSVNEAALRQALGGGDRDQPLDFE